MPCLEKDGVQKHLEVRRGARAARKSLQPQSVTYVLGRLYNPCLRSGPCVSLKNKARPERFELPTLWFEAMSKNIRVVKGSPCVAVCRKLESACCGRIYRSSSSYGHPQDTQTKS